MKKAFVSAVILLLCASVAFGAAFSPTPLRISAPQNVKYDFDGKTLIIPISVSGTAANITFMVYTKDKGKGIVKVKNGYLGWHYVNKIDTCVYFSKPLQFDKGTGNIVWDGKNKDGQLVGAGEYTYYLWGYDDRNPRILAYNWVTPGPNNQFIEYGWDGKPLTNPVVTTNNVKWVLGSDPLDNAMREITTLPTLTGWVNAGRNAYAQKDSSDFLKYVYMPMRHADSKSGTLWKAQWVPGGKAIRDDKFGAPWGQIGQVHMSAQANKEYAFVVANFYYDQVTPGAPIYLVDLEGGELSGTIDLSDWWTDPAAKSSNPNAQLNGGPGHSYMRDGIMYLSCHCSCLKQAINPMAFFGDAEDVVLWTNDNGDYVMDHNFETTAKMPWVCNDYNVGPYTYNIYSDANGFSFSPTFDMGAVSFGLLAPDGTGIGYFAFAGETAQQKSGVHFCDNGSAFDGIYSSVNRADTTGTKTGTWYSGHDSIKGTIGTQIGVKESAPAAFSVAQNTPNPFNPTTTINFTLAKAGKTTIEVFNAAGQKVNTILDANLNAGSHSATWNAAKFSAGVYFYTIRSGNLTRTMKMTLLK